VWMCVCLLYHPPSILTLTHSLRSFVASLVKSYGVNARVCFMGRVRPHWSIERSYRRWGAVPPEFPPLGGGTPGGCAVRIFVYTSILCGEAARCVVAELRSCVATERQSNVAPSD
jgi:hypothetical protein